MLQLSQLSASTDFFSVAVLTTFQTYAVYKDDSSDATSQMLYKMAAKAVVSGAVMLL